MFGKRQEPPVYEERGLIHNVPAHTSSQEIHQAQILADFQTAVRTNDQAEAVLRDAERCAAQAALGLVEARKRMRRVTDGVV